jgi:hypothetical protein
VRAGDKVTLSPGQGINVQQKYRDDYDYEHVHLKEGVTTILDRLISNYERQYNSTMPGTKDTPYRQTKMQRMLAF